MTENSDLMEGHFDPRCTESECWCGPHELNCASECTCSPRGTTDKERLDWLEKYAPGVGLVYGVIHDDHAAWAVATDGVQPIICGPHEEAFISTYFVDKEMWKPTVREAIDYAMQEAAKDDWHVPKCSECGKPGSECKGHEEIP